MASPRPATEGSFQPGRSGNPAGRPKKDFVLSAKCQEYGDEVVEFMIAVMRGEEIRRTSKRIGAKGKKEHVFDTPTFQDRIRAGEWLADRGFGKAPTVVAGPGGIGPAELVIICKGMPTPA